MNKYFLSINGESYSDVPNSFRKMIDATSNNPNELYNVTEPMLAYGEFELAIKAYKQILNLAPHWYDIFDLIARAYWAKHDYQRAKKYWRLFDDGRLARYAELGVEPNIFTVDTVFTASFGNFAFMFPILLRGYRSRSDEFYYHPDLLPFSEAIVGEQFLGNPKISNNALAELYEPRIKKETPEKLKSIYAKDSNFSRLPFYAALDSERKHTHFQTAWSGNLLDIEREIGDFKFGDKFLASNYKRELFNTLKLNHGRPIVTIHARESGYWNRVGDKSNSTKNADISTYIKAIKYLIGLGFQVVRLGDKTMRPLPCIPHLFDYALSNQKNSQFDLALIKLSEFMICTCSGPFQVAGLLQTPIVATNWVPIHILPFSSRDIVLPKAIRHAHKKDNSVLSFSEMLALDFGEFSFYNFDSKGYEFIDNNEDQILSAVKAMLVRLDERKRIQPKVSKTLVKRVIDMVGKYFGAHDRFQGYAISSSATIIDPVEGTSF